MASSSNSSARNPHCRHCGQRAPIRLDGIHAYCTVCNGKRTPFSARTLNWAGKPSRWGGTAAKVVGSLVLFFGLTFWASMGLIINAVGSLSWALGITLPFIALTLFFGGGFLFGGRKLHKSGDDTKRQAQLETVRALAAHRGGQISAYEVAQALKMPEQQADDMLTELAKDPQVDATLDLDEEGRIHYLFGQSTTDRWRIALERRIATGPAPPYGNAQAEAEAEAAADHAASARSRH